MTTLTITITALVADSVPDGLLHRVAAEASKPLLKPDDWMDEYGSPLLVANAETKVTIVRDSDTSVHANAKNFLLSMRAALDAEGHRRYASKIQVIKEVRALTNLGLKEAKDLVDASDTAGFVELAVLESDQDVAYWKRALEMHGAEVFVESTSKSPRVGR